MLRQMENKVTVNGKEFDINKKSELKECIIEVEKARAELANSERTDKENGLFGLITDAITEQLFNALDVQIAELKKIYDNMPDDDKEYDTSGCISQYGTSDEQTPKCEVSEDGTTVNWNAVDWNDPAWYNADDYLTDALGAKYDDLSDVEQYRILKTVADAYKWLYAKM